MPSKVLLAAALLPSLFFLVFTVAAQPSLNPTKTVFAPSEKITVHFSGFPGNSRDWISIARLGQSDEQYVSWQYLNNAQEANCLSTDCRKAITKCGVILTTSGPCGPVTVSKCNAPASLPSRAGRNGFAAGS